MHISVHARQGYQVNAPATRFAVTEVTVTILDVNDNVPTMSRAIYTAHVQEHLAAGTRILALSASDLDEVRALVAGTAT